MRVNFGETSGAIYEVLQQNEESRLCFVTTDDSQTSRTFVRAINKVLRTINKVLRTINKVLRTDLRCLLHDGSLGALLIKKGTRTTTTAYKTAEGKQGNHVQFYTW